MAVRAYLLVALILCTLRSGLAYANQPIVLMVNMNYSSTELRALEAVAQSRNQRVLMVPPREMIPLAEDMFRQRDSLERSIKRQWPQLRDGQVKAAISDYMLNGQSSDKQPEIVAAFGPQIERLRGAAQRLADAEQEAGPVYQQVRRAAQMIQSRGQRVDTFVFSAHSDGTNLSGESSARLSSTDVSKLEREYPALFREPRHVLLLGCYNMTENNHFRWRHLLFNNASLVAGFGVKAPSRWNPASANYITQVLRAADSLDNTMVNQGSPLDPRLISEAFRRLAAVSGTDSVIDYCLNLVEGRPGAARPDCDTQWITLMGHNGRGGRATQIEAEYLTLRQRPAKEPPDSEPNELRDFYSQLQATCPARNSTVVPRDRIEQVERYRHSIGQIVLRLMYWTNVQQNFSVYYERELTALRQSLASAGIAPPLPSLDGSTSRGDFIEAYNAIEQSLNSSRQNPNTIRLLRQQLRILYPVFALRGEGRADEDNGDVEATLARGGLPLNWIDRGVVRCPRNEREPCRRSRR
jgi:hypothetical protein